MESTPQEPDLAYFKTIPWCARLLSSTDIIITSTDSRQYKESTEDSLLAETFKTDSTIKACLSFYRWPGAGASRIDEIHTFLSLGHRLNGFPGIAHGGVVATVHDEVMGILLAVNKKFGLAAAQSDTVTAYLNVTYLKPVTTPQTVLASARFREVAGRKLFLETTIQDESGETLSKSEALWIASELPKLKGKI